MSGAVSAGGGVPRLAIAWELGGGLGHLQGCAKVAALARRVGWDVVVVARDVTRVREIDGLTGVPVVQAPLPERLQRTWRPPPAGLAEVLYMAGYRDAGRLRGRLDAWRATFDLLGVTAVVGDYAPTALLAAKCDGRPTLVFGHGFMVPPAQSPLPPFADASSQGAERAARVEQRVLDLIQQAVGGAFAVPAALYEVCRGTVNLLATVPELDYYPGRRGDTYAGPLLPADWGRQPEWSDDGRPRVFAYLKASEGNTRAMLAALRARDCNARVFCPDADRELLDEYRGSAIRLSRQLLALGPTLAGAGVAICNGGHDTVCAALIAGCPVAMLPTQAEQLGLAHRLAHLGAGGWLGAQATLADCERLLQRLLADGAPRRIASAFRAQYAGCDARPTLQRQLQDLLAGGAFASAHGPVAPMGM